jgi:DNA-binding SARP family transcriptional activator
MFTLKLFGSGSARYGEQLLDGFPSQQIHLLLCYILLNRHYPVNRETLASVFWGEYSTAVSKKHLSKAIWRLRRAFQNINIPVEEYLSITPDSISFLDSTQYYLDIEVFEDIVSRYQNINGNKLLSHQAKELQEAVSLYSGDLLEGVYLDWALNERERLGLLYQNALVQLMDYHEVNSAYNHALDYGRLLLRRGETYENVHRKMMRLYWLSGQRSAALSQYKQCQQILQQEFNASPSPETVSLYRQIQRNQLNRPDSPLVSTAPPASELTNAVKRLAVLQKTIEEATSEMRRIERVLSLALLQQK